MFFKVQEIACFFRKVYCSYGCIVLPRPKTQKVSGAAFGFVKTMLGGTFRLFILSLHTPVYDSDENKTNKW